MDNLDDLRLQVAKALGWKWYRPSEWKCQHCGEVIAPAGKPTFQIKNPNENWVECDQPEVKRVEEMLRYSHHVLPDWPNDWNAAMGLVKIALDNGDLFSLYSDGSRWEAVFFRQRINDLDEVLEACTNTGPEAICRAWLAWKGEQDGKAS